MPVAFGISTVSGISADRLNTLLYRPQKGACRTVVLFPGDISQLFRPSETQVPYRYSIEALAWLMASRFPSENIVVVVPCEMKAGYAEYKNFIPILDRLGNPHWGLGNKAKVPLHQPIQHLEGLLKRLCQDGDSLSEELSLVFFSKGATVANALFLDNLRPLFWSQVRSVDIVDPGLSIPGELFPLNMVDLTRLAKAVRNDFSLRLHLTPRQYCDRNRPWIRQEIDTFVQIGRNISFPIHRTVYFSDIPSPVAQEDLLDMHFDSLCVLGSGEQPMDDAVKMAQGFFSRWK